MGHAHPLDFGRFWRRYLHYGLGARPLRTRVAGKIYENLQYRRPTRPDEHYTVPALSRWDMEEIRRLIREKRYFVLHASRQTGKTSCLLALMEQLNAEQDYRALYANLEPGQSARGDVREGMRTIISGMAENAYRYLGDRRLRGLDRGGISYRWLSWCFAPASRPLVGGKRPAHHPAAG